MARTKQTHITTQKHTEYQDARDIQNKLLFCVFGIYYISIFNDFLNDFSRNVELPPWYG